MRDCKDLNICCKHLCVCDSNNLRGNMHTRIYSIDGNNQKCAPFFGFPRLIFCLWKKKKTNKNVLEQKKGHDFTFTSLIKIFLVFFVAFLSILEYSIGKLAMCWNAMSFFIFPKSFLHCRCAGKQMQNMCSSKMAVKYVIELVFSSKKAKKKNRQEQDYLLAIIMVVADFDAQTHRAAACSEQSEKMYLEKESSLSVCAQHTVANILTMKKKSYFIFRCILFSNRFLACA